MRGMILGLGLIAALAGLRLADPPPVQALREAGFDAMQRMAPRAATAVPVQVVDIDTATRAELGPWPWPRDLLARLVVRLGEFGASVVVLDMPLAGPDPQSPAGMADAFRDMGLLSPLASPARLAALDTDLRLTDALRAVPVVLGMDLAEGAGAPPPAGPRAQVTVADGTSAGALAAAEGVVPPLAVLESVAAGLGLRTAAADGVTRRLPLVWRGPDGVPVPSLVVEALRLAPGGAPAVLHGSARPPGLAEALVLGDRVIPVTPSGEMWLRPRPDAAVAPLSAREVLADPPAPGLRAQLEGRIVLVGTPPAGPGGLHRTALGESVPPVAIQAQAIEQVLAGSLLHRDALADLAEVAATALLGLVVLAAVALGGSGWGLVAGIAGGAGLGAASWYAFAQGGMLVDATYALGGVALLWVLLATARAALGDRAEQAVRQTFAHAVAPPVLDRLVSTRPRPETGGVTRPVTVLVCDIRNFGTITHGMTAPAVVDLLNRVFDTLSAEILAEGGTLDKAVGDAMVAFWNAPLDQPDHPVLAARAALRLRGALTGLNARGAGAGQAGAMPHVSLAMGLATGMGWVGRIGPQGRQTYAAVGETVSQAARVETACRHVGYDILLSAETARRARDLALLDAGSLHLRGGAGRIEAAIVVGAEPLAASTRFRDLEACHLTLLRAIREDDARRIAARLAECRGLAAAVEPGLRGFYDHLERRLEDYR